MKRPLGLLAPIGAAAASCVIVVSLLVLATATAAQAHNALKESIPAKGSRLASAPEQIELVFAERLDPQFTTVRVSDANGTAVTTGTPVISGTRATQALHGHAGAGTYTVAYRVVSVDGHPVQGSFTFNVTEALPPTAPEPEASASSAKATAAAAAPTPILNARPRLGLDGRRTIGLAALLAMIAAGGVLVWRAKKANAE